MTQNATSNKLTQYEQSTLFPLQRQDDLLEIHRPPFRDQLSYIHMGHIVYHVSILCITLVPMIKSLLILSPPSYHTISPPHKQHDATFTRRLHQQLLEQYVPESEANNYLQLQTPMWKLPNQHNLTKKKIRAMMIHTPPRKQIVNEWNLKGIMVCTCHHRVSAVLIFVWQDRKHRSG